MWLEALEVRNFRNLEDGRLGFQRGLNWLVGANGQGKTNCLEAAYFALTSKSFRTPHLKDLVRQPAEETEVFGTLVKRDKPTRLGIKVKRGKSQRYVGEKTCNALEYLELSSIIAYSSRSVSLVDGIPEDRRRFLDRMISYLFPGHMLALAKYRKIFSQVKKLLLRGQDLQVYRGFKNTALPIAERIVRQRISFLQAIRGRCLEIYSDVFGGEGELYFEYRLKNCDEVDQLTRRMMDLSAREMLHGKSLIGPHLDDLEIRFQGHRAKRFASSGQVRSIVLSMKLAVWEAVQNDRGMYPILLLDDIDAELDQTKLKGLVAYLAGNGQTLISTSKYGTIEGDRRENVFMVSGGRISPERTAG